MNCIKTVVFGKTIVFKIKKFTDNYVNDRYEESSLTIVNEGLSLMIVNETTNFIKTVVFGKKLHATLLNDVLHVVNDR